MAQNLKQKGGMMNILSNRATLYSVFFLSVVYLFFLLLNYDFPAVFFFGLVGLVSSFFTRNMIVVLSISLIVTMILKMGGVLDTPYYPPMAPSSETTITTEMVFFDEDDEDSEEIAKLLIEHGISDDTGVFEQQQPEEEEESEDGEEYPQPQPTEETQRDADAEIVQMVQGEQPAINELLMVPGYQSSIMLSNGSTSLDFENPSIELIPVDMDKSYGYEFNNPFSKLGQKCGISDHYSCYE